MSDVTELLQRAHAGENHATEHLISLVYNELRALAASRIARETPGQTLQPTALVHEAWLRLGGPQMPLWENRSHFFGAASEAMRRILIDRARKLHVRRAAGLATRESIDDSRIQLQAPETEIIEIDRVLDRLNLVDPRAAELVKLRYFAGLTMTEAAESLGLSVRKAERLWTFAKAWLRDAIRRDT